MAVVPVATALKVSSNRGDMCLRIAAGPSRVQAAASASASNSAVHHRAQSDYARAAHHLLGGMSARITTIPSIRRTSPYAVLRAHGNVPLETMHPLAPATGGVGP